jgi:hypothetical protein
MAENFALLKLMESEYRASGMNDRDFANYAMTKIKMRDGVKIHDHNVKNRREALGIPNNKVAPATPPGLETLAATVLAQDMRISQLTERIDLLEGWINATFPLRSGKKAI